MFDDYEFKNKSHRISFKFEQEKDEPLYPWEVAGFLSGLNAACYKNEVLNSICSAIKCGISCNDIFIVDGSLPIRKRSDIDVFCGGEIFSFVYEVGLPYPLFPNMGIYEFNFALEAFRTTNSFLHQHSVRALTKKYLHEMFGVLLSSGLNGVDSYLSECSWARYKKSKSFKSEREGGLVEEDFLRLLSKCRDRRQDLVESIDSINGLAEEDLFALRNSRSSKDRKLKQILCYFFNRFEKIERPLVFVRVEPDRFRVLGRNLFNRTSGGGVELGGIVKNSPGVGEIVGTVATLQAIWNKVSDYKIDHKIKDNNLKKSDKELELLCHQIEGQKLDNLKKKAEILVMLKKEGIDYGDLRAIESVPDGFIKDQIQESYSLVEKKSNTVFESNRMLLQHGSIAANAKKIDIYA